MTQVTVSYDTSARRSLHFADEMVNSDRHLLIKRFYFLFKSAAAAAAEATVLQLTSPAAD
jgi:hypothetical protein